MKLDVVGGTYRERCKEGEWRQLFGSGLRAAAALQYAGKVTFHTYIPPAHQPLLESMAATFGFDIAPSSSSHLIEFSYDHGLSTPLIFPPLDTVSPEQPLSVSGSHVLRFGMVDGDAIVSGDMVVYDPQSAYSPKAFHENGSSAKRLVIVCNRREAHMLAAENDILKAAAKIRSMESAEAVIVKCGSHGALLDCSDGQFEIPAFRTDLVWPIGSGDVFAAAFFARWVAGDKYDIAATRASMAAAHYCNTRQLPIPQMPDELPKYEALSLRLLGSADKKPLIYLAGPFFNMGQRWIVEESCDALRDQGLEVFSPFHDVGFGKAEEVVVADIEALKKSDVVLALLDQLDSGTLFEVGYARALGKPVIGFCQCTSEEALKMLAGTSCAVVDDFVSAIYQTAWTALKK
jgi:nucleoside 2-deoxyribosyltransferase